MRITVENIMEKTGKTHFQVVSTFKKYWVGLEARGTTVISGDEDKAIEVVAKYLM